MPVAATSPHHDPSGVRSAGPALLDPGWLFVIAGLALIGCSVLIPAANDLAEARYLRDRAMVIEQHRIDRLTRHEEFLEGLHAQDEMLALSLAASQLNQIPADRFPVADVVQSSNSGRGVEPPPESMGLADASVFPSLEPPALQLPERVRGNSLLERLVLSPRTGILFGLGGSVCVMIGLLPRARRA